GERLLDVAGGQLSRLVQHVARDRLGVLAHLLPVVPRPPPSVPDEPLLPRRAVAQMFAGTRNQAACIADIRQANIVTGCANLAGDRSGRSGRTLGACGRRRPVKVLANLRPVAPETGRVLTTVEQHTACEKDHGSFATMVLVGIGEDTCDK